jgi:hypothetical protein
MSRRRRLFALAALLLLIVIVYSRRNDVWGWWNQEGSYQGRYTNDWRAEFRHWDVAFDGSVGSDGTLPRFVVARRESAVEYWLRKNFGVAGNSEGSTLPLQEGNPAALPVLHELLLDEDPKIRLLALLGIGRIGAEAREALTAVKRCARDPDRQVRLGVLYVYIGLERDKQLAAFLHEAWKDDPDENLRAAAKLVLRKFQEQLDGSH